MSQDPIRIVVLTSGAELGASTLARLEALESAAQAQGLRVRIDVQRPEDRTSTAPSSSPPDLVGPGAVETAKNGLQALAGAMGEAVALPKVAKPQERSWDALRAREASRRHGADTLRKLRNQRY